jgi:hypothetical protein
LWQLATVNPAFANPAVSETVHNARPDSHEFALMPFHIIFQCNAHHIPKIVGRKSIIRVFIDPLKKRLAEYLESFKPKILALPGKPLDLIRRQRLGNDRINLISFPGSSGLIESLVVMGQSS